jgi:ligand-binding sensor domain-containing protein
VQLFFNLQDEWINAKPMNGTKAFITGLVIVLVNLPVVWTTAQPVRVIGTGEGMSSRQTIQTCQDKYGFIWVATKTGVDRFDGSSVKPYELPLIKSRYAYENYYLATDRDSLIWAYNDIGQIFKFSYPLDRFELFININEAGGALFYWLRDLHFSAGNQLYLATDLGLAHVSGNRDFKMFQEGELHEIVVSIQEISNDTLVFATYNKLYLFSIPTGQMTELKTPIPRSVRIQSLCYHPPTHTIWIGTFNHGLYQYNLLTADFGNLEDHLPNAPRGPIRSLTMADNHTLMIGADGQGVWVVDTQKMSLVKIYSEGNTSENQLSSNGVYDIFIDKEARIWVCTYAGGLNVIEPGMENFRILKNIPLNDQSLGNNNVNAILEDSRGNIWFGTNNGLSILKKNNHWIHLFRRQGNELNVFLALCEDNRGNVWAATYSGGVYIINNQFETSGHLTASDHPESIGTNYVFALFLDDNQALWMGGRDGFLSKMDLPSGKISRVLDIAVNSFMTTSRNELFIGGPQSSILLNTLTNAWHPVLSGFHVNCLYADTAGNLYHGTRGSGLQVGNKSSDSIVGYNTSHGLSSNHISHILPDGPYLWLSTENGLSRFDTQSHLFTNYLSGDGISDKTFNRSSGCKLRNGQILFGSNNGVTWFDPAKIVDREKNAHIYLEALSLFNQPVHPGMAQSPLTTSLNATDTLHLKHFQHSFSIHFTPISYFNAGKIKSSWRLRGLNDQWSTPSFDRTINYTNIPPGVYQLDMRVVDYAIGRLLDERTVVIAIAKPFWSTIWAKALYLVTLLLLLRWITLYIKARVAKRHSDEKIAFFTNAAHDLRTPLSLVNAPLSELKGEAHLSETGKYY